MGRCQEPSIPAAVTVSVRSRGAQGRRGLNPGFRRLLGCVSSVGSAGDSDTGDGKDSAGASGITGGFALVVAKAIRSFPWDDGSEYARAKGFGYPLGTLVAVVGRG